MIVSARLIGKLALIAVAGYFGVAGARIAETGVQLGHGELTSGLGVSVHTVTADNVKVMKDVGIHYIRLDLRWNEIEFAPGRYDWSSADEKVKMISAAGIRPILILAYSNRHYGRAVVDGEVSSKWLPPSDERSRKAFATWAAVAARRYAASRPVWEIWNEPDGGGSWPPSADVASYVAMAEETCQAIREVDARASIWGPALSRAHGISAQDSPFLKALLMSSLPVCLSAVSVHPYISWSEIDDVQEYWKAVRALPTTARKPFASSEWGIPSGFWGVTNRTQASYIVRVLVHDHIAGSVATIWYDWRDDGRDPKEREHHFGLVDVDGHSKPALAALKVFATAVSGLDRQCLIREQNTIRLFAWNTHKPERILLMIWTAASRFSTEPNSSVEVLLPPISENVPTGRDLFGNIAHVEVAKGEAGYSRSWRISGGAMPYYVRYSGKLPPHCL